MDRDPRTSLVPVALRYPYAGHMEIPIACSLRDTEARDQLDEWRELLARTTPTSASPTELRVRVGDDQVAAVVGLAKREKACCPFFDFTLHIEAGATILHIQVPEDAAAILDDFRTAAAWTGFPPDGDSGPGRS
jgi:hypothetical protein